ncbi:RNA polymerase sigma factor [Mogibacterium diversum]|uniref:RNA polymerase sigma factor n=1 Tax=Mogibacterium diversum TaxID=114527 RepID=UPI0028EF4DB4|nr:sigma factor-like helix-turn-helix DNA-binding protein [Mogibacterium diversum]
MRKFKTAEDSRTNYIYYTAEGKQIVIMLGMADRDGSEVTEEMITILHGLDDDQVDADRREEYKCPVHYDSYHDGEGEDADDRNPYLADSKADPLEIMLASIDEQEYLGKIERLKVALSTLTELQKDTVYKKFYLKMTNVDIAAEEGVSEAAIRNRLKKIYANLSKKIKSWGFDFPAFFAYGQRDNNKAPQKGAKQ